MEGWEERNRRKGDETTMGQGALWGGVANEKSQVTR